jgi:hypothetical protein
MDYHFAKSEYMLTQEKIILDDVVGIVQPTFVYLLPVICNGRIIRYFFEFWILCDTEIQ